MISRIPDVKSTFGSNYECNFPLNSVLTVSSSLGLSDSVQSVCTQWSHFSIRRCLNHCVLSKGPGIFSGGTQISSCTF